jgi:hypothetical protein
MEIWTPILIPNAQCFENQFNVQVWISIRTGHERIAVVRAAKQQSRGWLGSAKPLRSASTISVERFRKIPATVIKLTAILARLLASALSQPDFRVGVSFRVGKR